MTVRNTSGMSSRLTPLELAAMMWSMPSWPAPLPGETMEHFVGVTLPLHREAMEQWERDCAALRGDG